MMLELKAITIFVACWNIRQLAGQRTPIHWYKDRLIVHGGDYDSEVFMVGRTIYGQGETTNVLTNYGTVVSNHFCFRGRTDPTKGTWKVKGRVGLKSMTATGSYNLPTKHKIGGYVLIGNVTIGKATAVPAICGFVRGNNTKTSGLTTYILRSDKMKYIYNYKNEEEVQYMIHISKTSSYIHSLISIRTISANGSVDKPVCVSSYTRTPPNGWTAEGHINKATFNASGFYTDNFWMLTGLRTSTEFGIFAGVYRGDDKCALTKDCLYEIKQNNKRDRDWLITGKAYTTNGTWEITIPTGFVDEPSGRATARQVFKGTFANDGTFSGHGHAAGFSLSVNGKWGMGCVYTTSHNVSCSEKLINGLTARNYRGCGTASAGSGPFSGSGTYNGTRWHVAGAVTKDSHGMVTTKGTVTYNEKLLTFEGYGDPANVVYFELVQGDIIHSVYVRQIGTTWVAIGQAY